MLLHCCLQRRVQINKEPLQNVENKERQLWLQTLQTVCICVSARMNECIMKEVIFINIFNISVGATWVVLTQLGCIVMAEELVLLNTKHIQV